jgi:hypothetical protein
MILLIGKALIQPSKRDELLAMISESTLVEPAGARQRLIRLVREHRDR